MMIDSIIVRLEDLADKCFETGEFKKREGIQAALKVVHDVFRENEKTKTEFRQYHLLPTEVGEKGNFDRLDNLILSIGGLRIYKNRLGTVSYELDNRVFQNRVEVAKYLVTEHDESYKKAFGAARTQALELFATTIRNLGYNAPTPASYVNDAKNHKGVYDNE